MCVCVCVCVAVRMHFKSSGKASNGCSGICPLTPCACAASVLAAHSFYCAQPHGASGSLQSPLFYLSPLFFFPLPFLHPSPALPRCQCLGWNTFLPSILLDKAQCFCCGLHFLVNNQTTVIAWYTVFLSHHWIPRTEQSVWTEYVHGMGYLHLPGRDLNRFAPSLIPHWAQAKLLF